MSNKKLGPLKRFRQLMKLDRKDITQVYLYALFNGLVNLSLPLGIQAIINLIQGAEMSTSWIVLVSFVIAGILFTGILQLLQLRIVENIAQKIFSRASFEFAYRIPFLKHDALYNYYPPELANRFFDTMTIQKGMPKILIDFSLAFFQIVVGLLVLSMYHSFFILYSVVLAGLVYVLLVYTGPKGLESSLRESTYKYKLAFWLEEIARTKLSFKQITGSKMNLKKSDEYVHNYLGAREKHFKVLIEQFLYLIGFKTLVAAGLLISGSILVFQQEMNIGQFVAAEIIIILIINSVEKLIKSLDSIYDVLTALEKIGKVTDFPLDRMDGTVLSQDRKGLSIAVMDVSYEYENAVSPTLKNINFHIPENKSVVIHGPAASGKSTLFRLLSGILRPDRGLISFDGHPYESLNRESLKSLIGYSLNSRDIFHGTILENISMGREAATPERVKRALEKTNLLNFIAQLPMGLQTMLDPEGKRIPRSAKDKILLARALATEPILLLLEDPLEHVLAEEKAMILGNLCDESQPWSIIVSSIDPLWKEFIKDEIIIDNGVVSHSTFDQ